MAYPALRFITFERPKEEVYAIPGHGCDMECDLLPQGDLVDPKHGPYRWMEWCEQSIRLIASTLHNQQFLFRYIGRIDQWVMVADCPPALLVYSGMSVRKACHTCILPSDTERCDAIVNLGSIIEDTNLPLISLHQWTGIVRSEDSNPLVLNPYKSAAFVLLHVSFSTDAPALEHQELLDAEQVANLYNVVGTDNRQYKQIVLTSYWRMNVCTNETRCTNSTIASIKYCIRRHLEWLTSHECMKKRQLGMVIYCDSTVPSPVSWCVGALYNPGINGHAILVDHDADQQFCYAGQSAAPKGHF